MAPAHSLTLPTLAGIKSKYEVSYGCEAALAPARAFIEQGWLNEKHLSSAKSVVEALGNALAEIVEQATPPDSKEPFSIEIHLTDRLDGEPEHQNVLFFVWTSTDGAEYIPLFPFFRLLDGNPYRERLMATLYHWLYQASQKVLPTFGFDEAERLYNWRMAVYEEDRESGEDVDSEGKVEAANPASVPSYIRNSAKLRLRSSEIAPALASLANPVLRDAFQKAQRLFLDSRKIRLPQMSRRCIEIQQEIEGHFDGDPLLGLGLSHWRDDAIVAWLDEYCNDQFNSGAGARPMIVRCLRPNEIRQLIQLVKVLPKMIGTIFALSEWLQIARDMELAGGHQREDET